MAAERWVERRRQVHRRRASPLAEEVRAQLEQWFEPGTLSRARIRSVPPFRNPAVFAHLPWSLPRLPVHAAITFGDTILVSRLPAPGPAPASLVFHELVHVVQYDVLGIAEFTRLYLAGWVAHGFRYRRIPLEVMAFELQRRFDGGERLAEPVEVYVRRALTST